MRTPLTIYRFVRLLPVVCLVCCFLLPAGAEEGPPLPPLPSRADRMAQLFMVRDIILEKYDRNGDGVIDSEEKKMLLKDADDVRREARRKFLEKFDLDHDGKLSKQEHEKMHEFFRKAKAAVHARKDESSGPVSAGKPEHAGGGNKHEILPPPPPMRVVVENARKKRFAVRPALFLLAQSLILKKYDTDGDGMLSRGEVDVIVRDSRKLYADKAARLLARYDRDGDGVLSEEERKAALETIRKAREQSDEDDGELDDIDLFIQETYDTELMESLEEGYDLLRKEESGESADEDGAE